MILRIILISITCLILSACAGQSPFEVSAQFGVRQADSLSGHSPVDGGVFQIRKNFRDHGLCTYTHVSTPTRGAPFNKDYDVSDDFIGCGFRFGKP